MEIIVAVAVIAAVVWLVRRGRDVSADEQERLARNAAAAQDHRAHADIVYHADRGSTKR